jgi:hypothetical protein
MDGRNEVFAFLLAMREDVVKAIPDVLAAERMEEGKRNGALTRRSVSATL